MPAPVVYVAAVIAGAGAVWAFHQFIYIPHIHPEVTRIYEGVRETRRRNQRRPTAPHSNDSDDEDDDDDDHRPTTRTTGLRHGQPDLQQRRPHLGTPRVGTWADSDDERYGAPFDPERRRGQPGHTIELADLAPEVREWRRQEFEDTATLRRRNVGPSAFTPATGSPATLNGRRVISTAEEATLFNPFASQSPAHSQATTLSPSTPIAARPAPATALRSPPAAAPAPRVERHNFFESVTPTHVIADPEDDSPPSSGVNTTAPGTPQMLGSRNLVATTGSVLFGEAQGSENQAEQHGQQEPHRAMSPAHTDLSSLVTSPALPTLPAIIGYSAPSVTAPVPSRGRTARAANINTESIGTAPSPALRGSAEGSPTLSSPASFQTSSTGPFRSPLYSPLGSGLDDSLVTPVQASYPSHRPLSERASAATLTARSPTGSSHDNSFGSNSNTTTVPSLSQTYHPQDLDYERGVVLLSPPSSRSESPFSVVSNSPGSGSPALSVGTNYLSLDGSVDATGMASGFGRSPLVPLGSPIQTQGQRQIGAQGNGQNNTSPSSPSPGSPTPSSTNYDSDFDLLLSSAPNSPYSMSPFASPHIGTIRHTAANSNNNAQVNVNPNTMSPQLSSGPAYQHPQTGSGSGQHNPGSPTARSRTNTTGTRSPVFQRATSPSATSTASISDIDFLDDDDSLGFNSDGWVSDHNPRR